MRYSYVTYTGNGSNKLFSVTFAYISRDHVTVLVDGVSAPFTWDNDTTVRVTTAPPNLSAVKVMRTTPKAAPLVDFNDASTLTESALDLATKQNLLIAQESDDKAEDIVAVAVEAATGAASVVSRGVPNNSVSDAGKVLRASGTAGAYAWDSLSDFATNAEVTAEVSSAVAPLAEVVLQTQTIGAAVSYVEFSLPPAYTDFRLRIRNLRGSANGQANIRVRRSGQSFVDVGASDYGFAYCFNSGAGGATLNTGAASGGAILLSTVTQADAPISGDYDLYAGDTTSGFQVSRGGFIAASIGGSNMESGWAAGNRVMAGACDLIRVSITSGNLTGGRMTLTGVRK